MKKPIIFCCRWNRQSQLQLRTDVNVLEIELSANGVDRYDVQVTGPQLEKMQMYLKAQDCKKELTLNRESSDCTIWLRWEKRQGGLACWCHGANQNTMGHVLLAQEDIDAILGVMQKMPIPEMSPCFGLQG